MIRNLKGLGLCLVAVLALGAVLASSASARFEGEGAGTITLTRSANTNQVFTVTAGGLAVTCTTVGGEGSGTGGITEDVTFAPTYSGCTHPAGTAHVSMNGCKYTFTSAAGTTNSTVHITGCNAGKKIVITVTSFGFSVCTYEIGEQTPAGTVENTNLGSGTTREVQVHSKVTGIVSTRTQGSEGICGPESSTTGTYSGSVTVTGEDPTTKAHRGIRAVA